jgi:uncharacterized membrane protein
MTADLARHHGLEKLLARVLRHGTWFATCVISVGVALPLIGWPIAAPTLTTASARIISAGIALFIFLPVLRVLLMLVVFVLERDYAFGAIATLVLSIIVLGATLSMFVAGGVPG